MTVCSSIYCFIHSKFSVCPRSCWTIHSSGQWHSLMCSLDFVVMRFLMKLFCTSNIDIVNECRMYCGFKLPSEIIPTRSDKFMLKLSNV